VIGPRSGGQHRTSVGSIFVDPDPLLSIDPPSLPCTAHRAIRRAAIGCLPGGDLRISDQRQTGAGGGEGWLLSMRVMASAWQAMRCTVPPLQVPARAERSSVAQTMA
jgi:hypothetical protein